MKEVAFLLSLLWNIQKTLKKRRKTSGKNVFVLPEHCPECFYYLV
jgi:hypothetical protein